MRYRSTRQSGVADGTSVDFETAVLNGLAPDGGLYVPMAFPRLSDAALRGLRGQPFAAVAVEVLRPFVAPSLDEAALRGFCDAAWSTFDDADVAPLRRLEGFDGGSTAMSGVGAADEVYLLELFHGPTLAFKDVALQLLGHLFTAFLGRRGKRATILGATSGDTGSAAIAGCGGRDGIEIVILHPFERTSAIQRRQMTTRLDDNVHNLAVRGTFDDCQAIVKTLFNDEQARRRFDLAAVNSINIARVLAQIVYYVSAAVALGAPDRALRFCVPTGNFGDVLAGHWARRLGVPIDRLIVATNSNDILARTLSTGRYQRGAVQPTLSPSMDIGVSSNFERLLFEVWGDDAAHVRAAMAELDASGGFAVGDDALQRLRAGFAAARCDDAQTSARIAQTYREHGLLVDPHSAVALDVAARWLAQQRVLAADRGPRAQQLGDTPPMVVLSTAHAAKFPDAVYAATGATPALPAALADLASRPERYTVVDNDVAAVRAYLAQHISAG